MAERVVAMRTEVKRLKEKFESRAKGLREKTNECPDDETRNGAEVFDKLAATCKDISPAWAVAYAKLWRGQYGDRAPYHTELEEFEIIYRMTPISIPYANAEAFIKELVERVKRSRHDPNKEKPENRLGIIEHVIPATGWKVLSVWTGHTEEVEVWEETVIAWHIITQDGRGEYGRHGGLVPITTEGIFNCEEYALVGPDGKYYVQGDQDFTDREECVKHLCEIQKQRLTERDRLDREEPL